MKLVNNLLLIITFCAFAWGLIVIGISIRDTVQFIRTKKTTNSIRLKDDYDKEKNNITVNLKYFNDYLNAETEGKIEVDPLTFKSLGANQIPIIYSDKSKEVYLQSYKEPNIGKLIIYLLGSILMIMILFLLGKQAMYQKC